MSVEEELANQLAVLVPWMSADSVHEWADRATKAILYGLFYQWWVIQTGDEQVHQLPGCTAKEAQQTLEQWRAEGRDCQRLGSYWASDFDWVPPERIELPA